MTFTNRRLSFATSLTINTGNYNSTKIEAGMEADLDDETPVEEGFKELTEIVDQVLVQSLADVKPAK